MQPIRNIHYTLLIRTANRLREFNFRKRTPSLYDTDVSDDRGNRYFFKMIRENETWQVQGNSLPSWIADNGDVINQSLCEYDAQFSY